MANASIFEKQEGKYISLVNRFFKTDYISRNLLRAFFGYTLCWVLGFLLVILYRAEEILSTMDFTVLEAQIKDYISSYIVGLLCYMAIAFVVGLLRYNHGIQSHKAYVAKLRRLEKRYEFQNRTKEMSREVKKHDRSFGV